jgi:hypothetical protein
MATRGAILRLLAISIAAASSAVMACSIEMNETGKAVSHQDGADRTRVWR